MFCPYCGASCAETHKFCFRCGKPLPHLPDTEVMVEVPAVAVTAEAEPSASVISEEMTEPLSEVTENTEPAPPEPIEPGQEVTNIPPAAPADPPPQPKKGRLWPPLVFLTIMICVGLTVFLWNGANSYEDASCFTVEKGVLYFDCSRYTGPAELTIPDTVNGMTVTAISDGCFADCDRLTTVIIPSSVTEIGDNAFSGCDGLRGIYIPDGVTSIGAGALSGCTALEAVYFPGSALAIGAKCLDNCTALRYLIYDGTYDRWLELYNGNYPAGMELHTNDGVYYAQP